MWVTQEHMPPGHRCETSSCSRLWSVPWWAMGPMCAVWLYPMPRSLVQSSLVQFNPQCSHAEARGTLQKHGGWADRRTPDLSANTSPRSCQLVACMGWRSSKGSIILSGGKDIGEGRK